MRPDCFDGLEVGDIAFVARPIVHDARSARRLYSEVMPDPKSGL